MHIAELCQKRPIATLMVFISSVLVGIICFQKLSVNFLPDISTPRLTVKTTYRNASPDEVSRLITVPIEESMNTLQGVKNIRSLTREGMALIQVDFYWGTDMNYAFIDAREKLDRLKAQLPKEIDRPTILRVDPASEPIMMLVISPKRDSLPKEMSSIKNTQRGRSKIAELANAVIKRRIEQLEGVAQAAVLGAPTREMRVKLNTVAMNSLGLSIADVSQQLAGQNVILSGGSLRDGNYRLPLRLEGKLKTRQDIERAVVGRTKDARAILLSDIGTVTDDFAAPKGLSLWNEEETIQILIRKESDANTVATAEKVREVLRVLKGELPAYEIEVISDQSSYIKRAIDDIIGAIYTGAFLAFFVLFFFLNELRYSAVIAIATPLSIILTFIFLYAFGVDLNIISLTGIAVGIGMLGDNAIIVVENVSRLCDEGMERRRAIIEGVKEINLAAAASTFTNVAIFLPVIFTDGIAREIFRDMGLAMTFSLLSSLIIAISLVPALLSLGFGEINLLNFSPRLQAISEKIATKRMKIQLRLIEAYEKLLKKILFHRGKVILGSLAVLGLTVYLGTFIPVQIVPKLAHKELTLTLMYPAGFSFESITASVKETSRALRKEAGVKAVSAEIGQVSETESIFSLDESRTTHSAFLTISLQETMNDKVEEEKLEEKNVIEGLRKKLESLSSNTAFEFSLHRKQTTLERIFRPEKDDFKIKIIGNQVDELQRCAPAVEKLVREIPEVKDIRTGKEKVQRELWVSLNRESIARYGLRASDVERFLESATGGLNATVLQEATEKIALTLYLENDSPKSAEELLSKRMKTPFGDIELRNLLTLQPITYYGERFRENGKNQLVLKANAAEGASATEVSAVIEERIKRAGILPTGLRVEIGGENEEVKSSFKSLFIILLLSLLLVYMILAAEFESLLYPLVIMLTSPLAVVGAIILMMILGESYNSLSLIGLVIMIGAVDNDAVIATDFIVELRRNGYSQSEAIFLGVSKRLRSIVMTTVTTVIGIVPLLFSGGSGSELGASISTPLIGGLISATVFTLVTIPAVFTYLDKHKSS
ncbi:MAG: efflux RND transporter permease subunit [Chloroherpetonaceae bacterium]|nr:efflux RND transporter permease subunit [Chloroherpetonaceae bacterium]